MISVDFVLNLYKNSMGEDCQYTYVNSAIPGCHLNCLLLLVQTTNVWTHIILAILKSPSVEINPISPDQAPKVVHHIKLMHDLFRYHFNDLLRGYSLVLS